MLSALVGWVNGFVAAVRERYGVDPWIYIGMMIACSPPFYLFLFLTLRALAKRDMKRTVMHAGVSLLIYMLPTFYILLFGHNLPWWIWLLAALLAVWAVYTLLRRLRRSRSAR